ncbi:hypothetical protein [Akkermansia massiliensis]
MLYKPLTACEKKSSRIRTFPMAASSNFFPSLPERHKTPLIKTSLNTLIVNVFKNIIPSNPDMPESKNQRSRPVIPAVGALCLLPEKIFSVPLRRKAAPPELPHYPGNFIPPPLPEKSFARFSTGTAAQVCRTIQAENCRCRQPMPYPSASGMDNKPFGKIRLSGQPRPPSLRSALQRKNRSTGIYGIH